MSGALVQAHGLQGKVVIVTGGGRGLGRAISAGFAQAGARVALVGRDAETLEQARREIIEAGGEAQAFAADVSSEAAIQSMCEAVVATWGRIDVLVNNAGINPWYKAAEDTPLAQWQAIIDVNLTGVFLACKHAGKHMLAAGEGAIINITSVAGRLGLSRTTAYCAAKGGVELMTRQLAMDWATRGVRVNAVAPGYFSTDLTEGMRKNEGLSQRVTERTPLRRFGDPEEIVGACLFLASPAASYVTGQSLGVDGGWTAC
ncbi:3-oxoacyl-ACP reductase FabG [Pseudomonas sp. JQ170]|uniref:SDR family NAD(P)-dependent oxidoreductase n=1 Tax=unclassified Pseudomonas TaxID=196821 RepID=UPI002655A15D|nr:MULTISPECIES: 3-oxoacyl-ACP reductase family protein [unclassified Pseudomonas]MDN7139866.1 3-oxoacyl-ACP reductase FabG [Pseudomonas sp. JQ170]WRO73680.1 3-oxoacyl-ACP reductase family protein [Pseudomonas sp. 170C]